MITPVASSASIATLIVCRDRPTSVAKGWPGAFHLVVTHHRARVVGVPVGAHLSRGGGEPRVSCGGRGRRIVRRWTDAVGEGVAQRCERCLNLVSVVRSVEVRGYAEIPGRRGRAPEDEGDVPEPEVELAAEVLAVGDGDDGRVGGRDAREGEVGEDVGSVSRRSGRARFVRDGADGGGVGGEDGGVDERVGVRGRGALPRALPRALPVALCRLRVERGWGHISFCYHVVVFSSVKGVKRGRAPAWDSRTRSRS